MLVCHFTCTRFITTDIFESDLDAPDVADILEEELRGHAQLRKAVNGWSPYESKTVSH